MQNTNPKVNFYFTKDKPWKDELNALRTIVLGNKLEEELKWGCPCYTLNGKNVVLIHEFKEYCALLFFKGALLKDEDKMLIQQTENVQAARQMRFTNADEISDSKVEINAFIQQAIKLEQTGAKVLMKKTEDFKVPDELQQQLNKNAELKKAFYALTPGRQKGYIFYFAQAKQPKTREARIEKCMPDILKGKGLTD